MALSGDCKQLVVALIKQESMGRLPKIVNAEFPAVPVVYYDMKIYSMIINIDIIMQYMNSLLLLDCPGVSF